MRSYVELTQPLGLFAEMENHLTKVRKLSTKVHQALALSEAVSDLSLESATPAKVAGFVLPAWPKSLLADYQPPAPTREMVIGLSWAVDR